MGTVGVICPECGWPFRWDEIGTHDVCPHCHENVNCIDNVADWEKWNDNYSKKITEMAGGSQ